MDSNQPPRSSTLAKMCLYLRSLTLAFWVTVILWLSLIPQPPGLTGPLPWDKLLHAAAYGLLALLAARVLVQARRRTAGLWWLAFAIAVGYGGLLEVLQALADTGRTAEWGDLLADATGALLAYVVFRHTGLQSWVQPLGFEPDHG